MTALFSLMLASVFALIAGEDCVLKGYRAHCRLNILDEHIDATAIINHCHVPVDITFYVTFQYKNLTKNKWEYTFVTTNQNERVLIPGLIFPNVEHAPVFLYARVPMDDFDLHNDSFISIEASFVAELTHQWEEAEFLNHSIFIQSREDCTFKKRDDNNMLPWIIGGSVFGVLTISLLVGIYCYNRQKLSLDELALVSSLDAGIPGARPYQMGELSSQPNGPDINNSQDQQVPVADVAPNLETTNAASQGEENHLKSGRRGFRFGRLREDPEEMIERAVAVCDKSMIIGNPLCMKDKNTKKKGSNNVIANVNIKSSMRRQHENGRVKNKKEVKPVIAKTESDESGKSSPSENQSNDRLMLKTSRQNSDEGESSVSSNSSEHNLPTQREVVPSSNGRLSQERLEGVVAQGARPKLKRTSSRETNDSSHSASIEATA